MKVWGMEGRSASFNHWPWCAHDRSPERESNSYVIGTPPENLEVNRISYGQAVSWESSWPKDRNGGYYEGNQFGSGYRDIRHGGYSGSGIYNGLDSVLRRGHPSSGRGSHQGGRRPIQDGSRHPIYSESTVWGGRQSGQSRRYPGSRRYDQPPRYPESRNLDRGSVHTARGRTEPEVLVGIVEEPYEPSVQSSRRGGLRMIEWPSSRSVRSSHHSAKSSRHSVAGSAAPTQRSNHGSRRTSKFQ